MPTRFRFLISRRRSTPRISAESITPPLFPSATPPLSARQCRRLSSATPSPRISAESIAPPLCDASPLRATMPPPLLCDAVAASPLRDAVAAFPLRTVTPPPLSATPAPPPLSATPAPPPPFTLSPQLPPFQIEGVIISPDSTSVIEKPLQRHGGRLEHNETYYGSCYGAETSDEHCCNSCEEVHEAYRKKGWGLSDPDMIDQRTLCLVVCCISE